MEGARVEWEHKFGQRGAVTVAVFHDQVEDVQDFIPRTVSRRRRWLSMHRRNL